jgi:autotransporter-associated beta strand protein
MAHPKVGLLDRTLARFVIAAAIVVVSALPGHVYADMNWDGDNAAGNFSFNDNWFGTTQPSWNFGNGNLNFAFSNNPSQTSLYVDYGGWRETNDIFWLSTYGKSMVLSSDGNGFDFTIRIENQSNFAQTVSMPLSGGKNGVDHMELNPRDADLTISGPIFNDNSVDYHVWGSFSPVQTTLTLSSNLGVGTAAANVDFIQQSGRNTLVNVAVSQAWAGTTTVNSGSFVTGSGVTLASPAIVVGGGTVATTSANTFADSATLTVNSGRLSIGGDDTVASLSGTGGTVDLAAGATLTAGNSGTTSFGGTLAGSGNFTKVGSGTFTLTAASTYTGTTTVSAGRLSLTAANLLADSTPVTGAAGGVLAIGGNETIGSLAGSVDVVLGSSTLTVGGNGGSTTHAGAISGAGGLVKVGAGSLALTGSSGYGGGTQVNAGTLQVDGVLGTTSSVSVAAGATLSGIGTINGATTIAGIHSPGNSPGVQTFNADLAYSAGSILNWELIANTTGSAGTAYDQIVIPTSNLTFSGSTNLALSFNAAGSTVDWADSFWNVNRSWLVLDLSSGVTTGIGNLSLGGSLLDSLGNTLNPSTRGSFSLGQSGQDVVLNFVAVPEPGTYGVALIGIGLAAWVRRLRRSSRSEVDAT